MGRYEIRVTINAPLKMVFGVYTQPDTWGWSDIRRRTWTQGKPWELDSRMEFEPKESFGATVEQVIVHFEPYRRVDWISHFGGGTLLSEIYFKSLSEDVTEISSKLEFYRHFLKGGGRGHRNHHRKRHAEVLRITKASVRDRATAVMGLNGDLCSNPKWTSLQATGGWSEPVYNASDFRSQCESNVTRP